MKKKRKARVMTEWFLGLAIFYTTLTGGVYLFQRRILYFPNSTAVAPQDVALTQCRTQPLIAPDNTALNAWYCPPQAGFATIVYFHGNAGHLGDRANKFRAFTQAGFGLMAVSYRGYGGSAGTPSEAGIYSDARTAIAYVTGQERTPLSRLVLYGESLGTGVAVQMASEHAVAAMVLEAPYTSVVDRGQEKYPFLPVSLLAKDRFESAAKLPSLRLPVLILHGERDTTIPVHHGRAMLELANAPKRGVFYPQTAHTDFDIPSITAELRDFAGQYGLAQR